VLDRGVGRRGGVMLSVTEGQRPFDISRLSRPANFVV
jgi:hypothetical protein